VTELTAGAAAEDIGDAAVEKAVNAGMHTSQVSPSTRQIQQSQCSDVSCLRTSSLFVV